MPILIMVTQLKEIFINKQKIMEMTIIHEDVIIGVIWGNLRVLPSPCPNKTNLVITYYDQNPPIIKKSLQNCQK